MVKTLLTLTVSTRSNKQTCITNIYKLDKLDILILNYTNLTEGRDGSTNPILREEYNIGFFVDVTLLLFNGARMLCKLTQSWLMKGDGRTCKKSRWPSILTFPFWGCPGEKKKHFCRDHYMVLPLFVYQTKIHSYFFGTILMWFLLECWYHEELLEFCVGHGITTFSYVNCN